MRLLALLFAYSFRRTVLINYFHLSLAMRSHMHLQKGMAAPIHLLSIRLLKAIKLKR